MFYPNSLKIFHSIRTLEASRKIDRHEDPPTNDHSRLAQRNGSGPRGFEKRLDRQFGGSGAFPRGSHQHRPHDAQLENPLATQGALQQSDCQRCSASEEFGKLVGYSDYQEERRNTGGFLLGRGIPARQETRHASADEDTGCKNSHC